MAEERTARRLAAILAADVVGYSRLMGIDEKGTARAMREHRTAVDPIVARHGGRIVKTTGDGILLEFPSIVAAVECAIAVQKLMTERNVDVPQDQRLLFRIGINLGDILIENDDILGDGVNIAARLEGIAEPGGICISESSYQQVRDRLAIPFEDMGEQQLKNIARPVRTYRVPNDGTLATERPTLALPDRPSIAVLPFSNMSGDVEQDYFADGMVEDIITGLARIKWLFVIGRNSSFAYKGKSIDIRQVGRELGVRYMLEGSVRRASARVRITSQLIDAQTGAHLWAERYDRPLDDIFALQDEITLSVIGAIEPSLRQAEIERVKRKRPGDLNAYDLVLRALPLVHKLMPDEAVQALALLDRALASEPDYAAAHGYAAWCHEVLFLRAGFHEQDRAAAIRHAHAARMHGRDDATALALAGFVIGLVEHDRVAALEAFQVAMALSPSSALAYQLGCVIVGWGGHAERAIEWGERAIRLSPFDPLSYLAYHSIALGQFQQGQFEAAVNAARKAIEFNPGFSINHLMLTAPLVKLARIEEAKASAARFLALQPSFSISRQLTSVDCAPTLAAALTTALREAGLPE